MGVAKEGRIDRKYHLIDGSRQQREYRDELVACAEQADLHVASRVPQNGRSYEYVDRHTERSDRNLHPLPEEALPGGQFSPEDGLTEEAGREQSKDPKIEHCHCHAQDQRRAHHGGGGQKDDDGERKRQVIDDIHHRNEHHFPVRLQSGQKD